MYFRYDGQDIASQLIDSVEMCQKRKKSNWKIRSFHYCLWAGELMRKDTMCPTKAQCCFPESVLASIRDIAPRDREFGEIRENTHIAQTFLQNLRNTENIMQEYLSIYNVCL